MSFDITYVPPTWARPLIFFNDSNGYEDYCRTVYGEFEKDWKNVRVKFGEVCVRARTHFDSQGRMLIFKHIVFGGKNEGIKKDDFRRFERIRWIRDVVENYQDDRVKVWEDSDNPDGKLRLHLWLDEEFLVVLERHENEYVLITAFPTDLKWRRKCYQDRYEKYCRENEK